MLCDCGKCAELKLRTWERDNENAKFQDALKLCQDATRNATAFMHKFEAVRDFLRDHCGAASGTMSANEWRARYDELVG